jgi:hypothetical protein
MFVSIVRDSQVLGDARRHASVYECDRYHINPVKGRPFEFTITMEGRKTACASYSTTEKDLGIYAMNDRGQTFETIFRSPAD